MEIIRKRLAALSLAAVTLLQIPLVGSAAEDYTSIDDGENISQELLLTDSDEISSEESVSGDSDTEQSEISDTDSDESINRQFSLPEKSAVSSYDRGDVNGDARLTTNDAVLILRSVSGAVTLDSTARKAADVDLDGKIGVLDSLRLQRYVAGLISDLDQEYIPPINNSTDTDSDKNETTSNGFGDNAKEDTSITVSGTSYSCPAGMTLYVTGASGVTWGSTNTDIATVDSNGLILAKKPGTVRIIALKGSSKRTINLTVTPSEAVRTVYASPNSAAKGSTVKLIATTDQTRTQVRFSVNVNGKLETVYATEKTADNEHGIYTWTGYIKASTAGTFEVTTSSEKDGSWSTCENGKTTMFVSSSSSSSQTALNTLRASDKVINMISLYEGGLSEAEIDPLAYGSVMNYGYGVVISAGEKFYNRASMSEYFADLVNQVNENIYSKYVNQYLQNNGIKYNQNQFDSLVCFVYNLGVYSLENAGIKSIMLNCYEPSSGTGTASSTATVSVSGYLNVRSGAGTNYSIIGTLQNGEKVTIVNADKVNGVWVKVKTASGLVGYCSSDYLVFGSSTSGVRNFNYINANSLINELLAWHHAGGNCYWGLLYRRIDELEMFLYADYTKDGNLNKHGWKLPSCIAG